jgi:predicted secreted protein
MPMTHHLTQVDANTTLRAKQDDTIDLALPQSAGTGYVWTLQQADPKMIRLLSQQREQDDTQPRRQRPV